MLKNLFVPPSLKDVSAQSEPPLNPAVDLSHTAGMRAERLTPTVHALGQAHNGTMTAPQVGTFEQIYDNAAVNPPRLSYGILKVAEMLNSPHLGKLTADGKRSSILMALEAAGAKIEDVLQDALVRQRALNDYEDSQKNRLEGLEQLKLDENRKLQEELDRLTAQCKTRVQENLDEIDREQEHFRGWQKPKQQELERITEAAAYCVPRGAAEASKIGMLNRS